MSTLKISTTGWQNFCSDSIRVGLNNCALFSLVQLANQEAPRFSWNAARRHTSMKQEIICNNDKHAIMELELLRVALVY